MSRTAGKTSWAAHVRVPPGEVRLLPVDHQGAELGERHLVVDDLLDLHAGDPGHALPEFVSRHSISLGDIAALPERESDRGALPRQEQEAFESFEVAKPAMHLLADDGRVFDRLVSSFDACERDVHRRSGLWPTYAAGTASWVQTVPSSTGAGHTGERVVMLATTHTSANACPTTTERCRSNTPSASGASDHSARIRGVWPATT